MILLNKFILRNFIKLHYNNYDCYTLSIFQVNISRYRGKDFLINDKNQTFVDQTGDVHYGNTKRHKNLSTRLTQDCIHIRLHDSRGYDACTLTYVDMYYLIDNFMRLYKKYYYHYKY